MTDPPPPKDDANVQKAVRFWTHPSLQSVPAEEKRKYLRGRGVTDDEIDEAWERIATKAPQAPTPQALQAPQAYNGPLSEEQRHDLTVAYGTVLVGLGGGLGLAAAAAVRWLNGGSFRLFPDAEAVGRKDREHEIWNGREEENEFVDQSSERSRLLETQAMVADELRSLADSVKAQTSLQEKLLRKLGPSGSITDESVNLLRKGKDQGDNQVQLSLWAQLVEIRSELSMLRASANGADSTRASVAMEKLEACLEALGKELNVMMTTTDAGRKQETPEPSKSQPLDVGSVRDALAKLVRDNDAEAIKRGCPMLSLYFSNLSKHPNNTRYRKIFTSNESFQKVSALVGSVDLLEAAGFAKDEQIFEWQGEEGKSLSPIVLALQTLQRKVGKVTDVEDILSEVLAPIPTGDGGEGCAS